MNWKMFLKFHEFTMAQMEVKQYFSNHYDDVIMTAMASQITSILIVYSPVIRAHVNENIKALRHWPLCGEFTVDRWIPRTNGQ